jgi:hypothetical protein
VLGAFERLEAAAQKRNDWSIAAATSSALFCFALDPVLRSDNRVFALKVGVRNTRRAAFRRPDPHHVQELLRTNVRGRREDDGQSAALPCTAR